MSKNYWLELLKLVDEQGWINAPEKKTLEDYLAEKLNLLKLNVDALLAEWEKKAWIKITKKGFIKKSVALQILKREKESALILIDWENVVQNWPSKGINLTYESVYQRFTNLMKEITQEAGAVFAVYVFSPDYLTSAWAETFWKLGFPIISCPKIKGGEEREKDTVDETLMREGKKLINLPISHLCVVSGDSDFIPLYEEAAEKNIKIITVAASLSSLSRELFHIKRKVLLLFEY